MRRLLHRLAAAVKEDNQTAEGLEEGFQRTNEIREVYFAIVEGAVIVGALQAAANKSGSPLLVGAWLTGYAILSMYLLNGFKYLARLLIDEKVSDRRRNTALWIAGVLSFFASWGSLAFVSALVAEIIKNTIMI